MVPIWIEAGLWGLLAGSALVLGAMIAWFFEVPRRWVASIMGFGSGVLISAVSFELMAEAAERGGVGATIAGFICGAVAFTAANVLLSRRGAKHRKRSNGSQPSEAEASGSGLTIAVGALLDGIPESIVIGVGLIGGQNVSLVAVAAVFLSNVPEGLSSAAGMKRAGRPARYVFGIWLAIAVISALSAIIGYVLFRHLGQTVIAGTMAVAAGAILAMIIDTMVPEAFEETHEYAGLIAVTGFVLAFALSRCAE
jgi:zinc transporter, ZIP family